MNIGTHTVEITHPDKELFTDITKKELVEYYQKISQIMLPHVKKRPISMQRFPDGIKKKGFYQKEVPEYFPSWITTYTIKTGTGKQEQVAINNAATLIYLANQACITPHTWLCSQPRLTKPDRLLFDLDPSKEFTQVKKVARLIKDICEDAGLTPHLLLTGGKGVHIVMPLKAEHSFDKVRSWAKKRAEEIVHSDPDHCTLEQRKDKRQGKIFIDYLRNAYGQTSVPPYAVRAHDKAPIATPINWSELSTIHTSQQYTLKTIFKRISRKGDIWSDITTQASTLPKQ
ncbi:ATP-dependent DNA ligase [Candidatus Woesearchaeota archaeon]|nr:ATP-dependent DNA ligase [Candidatus Woesearchaeota archaeon]